MPYKELSADCNHKTEGRVVAGKRYETCLIDGLSRIALNYYMHKEPRIKALPAAFMLVLFLVVSFFGSEGTLLCFGQDGHVAIEFVDACNGSGFDSHLAGMESDACGPCKDVQFLSSPVHTNNASHYTHTLALNSPSPMSPALPLKEYSNKQVTLPESLHHKTLASLHSVILLI